MVIPILLSLAGSLVLLIVSGRYAIRSLTNITTAFGVSEFTVAFIVLAIATSMPELFVAVSSSMQGASEIIISTILGSNIINITLVLGLATIFSGGIVTEKLSIERDLLLGTGITILPLLLLLNGVLSKGEGIILLVLFALYVRYLIKTQSKVAAFRRPKKIGRGILSIFFAIASIVVLIFSANSAVQYATELAVAINIPAFLIGIFLLAAGTSLPEFVATLQSNRDGKPAMSLGNVLGSNITNSSLILGTAAIISPIQVALTPALLATMAIVAISSFLMNYFAIRGRGLSMGDGIMLFGCFLLFGIVIAGFGLGV